MVCSVICCGLFSVSAFATEVDFYDFGGLEFPSIPSDYKYAVIVEFSDGYHCVLSSKPFHFKDNMIECQSSGLPVSADYLFNGNDWVFIAKRDGAYSFSPSRFRWTNTDIYDGDILFAKAVTPVLIKPIVKAKDFMSVIQRFHQQLNVKIIVSLLVAVVGVSVCFVFMWWGVRKVSGALIRAFKKGKIRI